MYMLYKRIKLLRQFTIMELLDEHPDPVKEMHESLVKSG